MKDTHFSCNIFFMASLLLNLFRRDMAEEMDMMRQQVASIISHKSIIHSDILSSENEDPTAKKSATLK